ncbi:MAG: hypothetical protein R2710_17170 [Acidimicrobiales bacterium]
MDDTVVSTDAHAAEEHFKPTGTIFFVALFVAALILLWASVYVILAEPGGNRMTSTTEDTGGASPAETHLTQWGSTPSSAIGCGCRSHCSSPLPAS